MVRTVCLLLFAWVVACGGTGADGTTAGPTQASVPVVRVGAAAFEVELAITPAQHTQGLSGRPRLANSNGMLFVFQQEGEHVFWMKDMRFALDLVWIGAGCTVVDVSLNAPPQEPNQTLAQLPRYKSALPAQYVLEIASGEAGAAGIAVGAPVKFVGSLAGKYGC